jgi:hypothetical protein
MHGGSRQTRQHKEGTCYTSSSTVGTLKPARKLFPLQLARMPTDAQYNKKVPLINPTLSSLRAPATNEAREALPGPAASSLKECKNFIAGRPKRPHDSTEKGEKLYPFGSTLAYAIRFCLSQSEAAAPAVASVLERVLREVG